MQRSAMEGWLRTSKNRRVGWIVTAPDQFAMPRIHSNEERRCLSREIPLASGMQVKVDERL